MQIILLMFLAVAAMAQPQQVKEMVVVYKTHFDIGYTDLARNVVGYYRTAMIDKALDVVDRSRELPPEQRFVWTLSGWPMTQILWPGQDPARRKRVFDAYREGRFVTHALPFTTHTESLEPEDLVRGLGFSSRLARSVGQELPRDAKMTDVPSHSWILPTLLKHAGIEFLHIGCNPASAGPEIPRLFWWEGPDGSRVLTMYSHGAYGSALAPPADWPHPVWLALIHSGDNEGPPAPEAVEKLFDEAKRKLPGVKVRIGRLSDFSDALLKTQPKLEVVRGDMPDTWIQGIMSHPQDTARARNERPRIAALETLDTLLKAWGIAAGAPPAIDEAYEQSLLYGEHTWGMDSKRFGPRLYGDEWRKAYESGRYTKLDESFEEHAEYSKTVERVVAPAIKDKMLALARNVNARGRRVVVYNPLPWKRDGVARTDSEPGSLRDATSGEIVSVDEGGEFVARGVPALGYKTYVVAAADAGQRSGGAPIDPGVVEAIHERYSHRDVEEYATAYLDRHMSWAVPDMARQNLPESAHTTGSESGASVQVKSYGRLPFVDVTWTIKDKPKETWPEAGWLKLAWKIREPEFRLGRLGGIVDPGRDVVRGANHEIYALNTGMVVLEKGTGRGVGMCPIDSPLVSLERTGGYRYTKDFLPSKPVAFVNLYNNLFGTNFAQWIGGTWTSRVRVWEVENYDPAASLITPSMEARVWLESASFDGPAGKLPAQRSGVELSRAGVLVTAFGPNPDGEGTVLRLWEQAGRGGPCRVQLPVEMRVRSAQPCDLRGRPRGKAIAVQNGVFTFGLPHNAPATFLLR